MTPPPPLQLLSKGLIVSQWRHAVQNGVGTFMLFGNLLCGTTDSPLAPGLLCNCVCCIQGNTFLYVFRRMLRVSEFQVVPAPL